MISITLLVIILNLSFAFNFSNACIYVYRLTYLLSMLDLWTILILKKNMWKNMWNEINNFECPEMKDCFTRTCILSVLFRSGLPYN